MQVFFQTFASVIPKAKIRHVHIGQDLPDESFCYRKLQASVTETTTYINISKQAADILSKSDGENVKKRTPHFDRAPEVYSTETNVRSMGDQRCLCHATVTSEPDHSYTVGKVSKWRRSKRDPERSAVPVGFI